MRSLGVLGALLALAACGGDAVESQFEDRAELPSCGAIDASVDETWRDSGPEEWDCFADAVAAGEPAELAVTFHTQEGDPIRRWYRSTGDGGELYDDSTRDTFGSGEWTFQTCDTLLLEDIVRCG